MKKKGSNRWMLYIATLMVAFGIVSYAGIRNAREQGRRLNRANSEKYALMAGEIQFSDPSRALTLLDSARMFDSAHSTLAKKAFDLFYATEFYPLPQVIYEGDSGTHFACSHSGRFWTIGAGKQVLRMDMESGEQWNEPVPLPIEAVASGDSMRLLAWGDAESVTLRKGESMKGFPEFPIGHLEFSPDNRILMCLSGESVAFIGVDSMARINFDLEVSIGIVNRRAPLLSAWSPSGRYAAVSFREPTVYIYDFLQQKAFPLQAGPTDNDYPIDLEILDLNGQEVLYLSDFSGDYLHMLPRGPKLSAELYNGESLPTGTPLYTPQNGRYDVLRFKLSGAGEGLVSTQRGALAEVEDAYIQRSFRGTGRDELWQGVLLKDGSVIGHGARNRLYRWSALPQGQPYVSYLPDSTALVTTPPHFDGDAVEMMDLDGRTTRWDLGKGLLSDTMRASSAALAAVKGPESEAWSAAWVTATDSTLQAQLGWRISGKYRDLLVPKMESGLLGSATTLYKISPKGESLLMVKQDDYSKRFYNRFIWIPLTAGKALEIIHLQMN